ncbi:MAG: dihydroneopterin aldolase [Planctomycetaceae bacterium]|nr:dihydroneopterin aldolase [Planctomycetaceae bacterium]
MADLIVIEDLLLRTIIGINPEERLNRQDVVVNITLETCTQAAAASDSIDDAVNYRTICKQVIDFVEASSFQLVETLAEEISRICLADPRVSTAQIAVRKPGALRFARSVGVTITRSRN